MIDGLGDERGIQLMLRFYLFRCRVCLYSGQDKVLGGSFRTGLIYVHASFLRICTSDSHR